MWKAVLSCAIYLPVTNPKGIWGSVEAECYTMISSTCESRRFPSTLRAPILQVDPKDSPKARILFSLKALMPCTRPELWINSQCTRSRLFQRLHQKREKCRSTTQYEASKLSFHFRKNYIGEKRVERKRRRCLLSRAPFARFLAQISPVHTSFHPFGSLIWYQGCLRSRKHWLVKSLYRPNTHSGRLDNIPWHIQKGLSNASFILILMNSTISHSLVIMLINKLQIEL